MFLLLSKREREREERERERRERARMYNVIVGSFSGMV